MYKKLILSLLCDALGYLSFIIPFSDVVWAPLSAYFMTKLYKGKQGKVGAIVSFVEEILPWTDVVPTFTIMWFYVYVFKKENSSELIEQKSK